MTNRTFLAFAVFAASGCAHTRTLSTSDAKSLLDSATQEVPAYLTTLEAFVSVESGSTDLEGIGKEAAMVAARLTELGGTVEMLDATPAAESAGTTSVRFGKLVKATFTGTGKGKVLLIGHLDTVYKKGQLAERPFRVEGDNAYGLGVADDKQGVALILHTVALLKARSFKNFAVLTVLINGDEELGSPGSRAAITEQGALHDAVLSYEASPISSDKVYLATSGIASVVLDIKGKASHAGAAPEKGINALYELASQVQQTRDLSDPALGIKLNWTLATAGSNRNVIPASARATADVRVLRVADYDVVEKRLRERVAKQLIPDAGVTLTFTRRRPPLEATDASRALGARARSLYQSIGKTLVVEDKAEGWGTDAAFASLKTKAAVIESLGLQGAGAHSEGNETVLVSSVAPRLYLSAALVMQVGASGGR